MKILFLAPQPFFAVRGTPINVRHLVTTLGSDGHSVDLLCYPFGETPHLPGVRILRVWRPWGLRSVKVGPSPAKVPLDALMFFKAFWLCLRNRYDVIHAVEESAFFAVWLKRLFRTRFVYDMDSLISDQLAYADVSVPRPVLWLASALEGGAMRRADVVLTVCASLSEAARRRSPGARIVQIEDAPLEERFTEDTEGAAALRDAFGLGDAPCVVYTGNFEAYQGLELLVRAAARVALQVPAVRFVLVGGQADQIERLQQQAVEAGSAAHCVFTGLRPPGDMPAFMTLASVLASPRTRGENTALKLYTYMQSGRPIVATDLPTHTQVLDADCALLAAPDPESVAACIVRALRDPREAARLGRAAQARLEIRFSLTAFREKVRQAYASLVE